jgi:hypothetical protein
MKPRVALLAVTIPVVAAIVALRVAPHRDATITGSPVVEPATSSEKPIPVEEPARLPRLPEIELPTESLAAEDLSVSGEDADALRMRLLRLLAEEFRESIDEDIRQSRSVSPLEASERAAEEVNRLTTRDQSPERRVQ